MQTSASLLEQLRVGGANKLAWERWHALYEPLIRHWLKKHRLVPTDQDDIVQNVLLVVIKRLPEFHHNGRVGAFRNWLKTITIFSLREYWRKKGQSPAAMEALSALDSWEDEASPLSKIWNQEHDQFIARKLISMLQSEFQPKTWAAFERFVMHGESAKTIAESLGITPNAVNIATSRVMARFRQESKELLDDPEIKG